MPALRAVQLAPPSALLKTTPRNAWHAVGRVSVLSGELRELLLLSLDRFQKIRKPNNCAEVLVAVRDTRTSTT